MNTEQAYEIIAQMAVEKAGNVDWDSLIVEIEIFDRMCSTVHWFVKDGSKLQGNGSPSVSLKRDAVNAALFLRDNLLQTTGQRVWGLTFTFSKNGKFNIDYAYNKPEGFGD